MIQSKVFAFSSSLLTTNPVFGFATKNLKQIKLRMKAVGSIKKITKVIFCSKLGYEDGRRIQDEARRR